MTPDELAAEVHASPRTVRAWLRRTFPRSSADAGRRWDLTPTQVAAGKRHFTPVSAVESRSPAQLSSQVEPGSLPERLDELCAAPMLTLDEVVSSPCPVPRQPGVYGWWFRRPPAGIKAERCLRRDGGWLFLYVGISPKRPPANGRQASSQTLRDRVKYHYTGNAEGSTLRKTLGSLLHEELYLELRRVGSGKRMTFLEGERALSAWMATNARVSWIVDPAPWLIETWLIANVDLPLNIDGNKHNDFHAELVSARATAVAKARALPIVPNPGVGGSKARP